MFKDSQFVETPKVDARGQKLSRQAGKQKLQEFYDLAGVETSKAPKEASLGVKMDEELEDLEEAEEEEEELPEEARS